MTPAPDRDWRGLARTLIDGGALDALAALLPQRRRKRQPTLVSVSREASRAGIPVVRYEVKPDGTITIITKQPEPAAPERGNELDDWLTKKKADNADQS